MSKIQRTFDFLLPVEGWRVVIRRFPVSVFFSLALFILLVSGVDAEPDKTVYGRLLIAFVFGFFWFGIVDLLAESGNWSGKRKIIISVSVYVFFVLLTLFLYGNNLGYFLRNIMIALLLGVSLAPYVRNRDDLSFWFFNYKLWFGVSASIAAGVLWALGLCAILAALHYLFGVNLPIYKPVWMFACSVFTPLYALSWVPTQFSFKEEDCHSPPQLSFMTNGILVPLLLVYLLILYAYFVKIIGVVEVPRGQLVYMIAGFAIVGTSTYMSGWPLRDSIRLTRDFYKVFFPALIVPALIQLYSISLRIHQYGVTEDRYLVVLCAVWLLTISVAYTFAQIRKTEISMKLIPAVLIVFLVVSSFGPWSAPSVSTRSQYARLEKQLTAYNILQDGQITLAAKEIPFEDLKSISGSVEYLVKEKETKKLEKWFGAEWPQGTKGRPPNPQDITAKMNITFVNERARDDKPQMLFFVAEDKNKLIDIREYDYVLAGDFSLDSKAESKNLAADLSVGTPFISAKLENNVLAIVIGEDVFAFDLMPLVLQEVKKAPKDHNDMTLEGTAGNRKVKVRFVRMKINQNKDKYEVKSIGIQLFVGSQ